MNVIIAGGRSFANYKLLKYKCLELLAQFDKSDVVIFQGGAEGADTLAYVFAKERNYKSRLFAADWNDLYTKGAVIKEGRYGKRYNAMAGFDRNERMAIAAGPDGMLIAFWDGRSPGTKHMIEAARSRGLTVHVVTY